MPETQDLQKPKIVYAAVGTTANLQCNEQNHHQGHRQLNYRWTRQYGQMQLGADILNVIILIFRKVYFNFYFNFVKCFIITA